MLIFGSYRFTDKNKTKHTNRNPSLTTDTISFCELQGESCSSMKAMGIFRAPYYAVLSTNTSCNVNPLSISKEK
jgi:hypothetical protein